MRRTSVFASGENLGAERIHFARAFKYKRVEAAFGSRNPKRKTRFQRVFLLGKSLQSRYFKFWTDRLKSCPPALQGRAAFAAFERFAAGKTSAEGRLCRPEHFNPGGWRPHSAAGTQNERHAESVSFFLKRMNSFEDSLEFAKTKLFCFIRYGLKRSSKLSMY